MTDLGIGNSKNRDGADEEGRSSALSVRFSRLGVERGEKDGLVEAEAELGRGEHAEIPRSKQRLRTVVIDNLHEEGGELHQVALIQDLVEVVER